VTELSMALQVAWNLLYNVSKLIISLYDKVCYS
jgi:hypothetical protein